VSAVVAALAAATVLAACSSSEDLADDRPAPTSTADTGTRGGTPAPGSPAETSEPDDDGPGDDGPIVPDDAALDAGQSDPVEDPYYPRRGTADVDVLHYFLDLDWDGAVLTGRATVSLQPTRPVDSLRLDLSTALDVTRTALDGSAAEHHQAGDALEVRTGPLLADTTYTLTIEYAGEPRTAAAPSNRSDMTGGLGWTVDPDGNVHTFQEPFGAYTWYPVNDHPSDEALYDARITTYGGDVAVFNGERVAHEQHGDIATSTWHVDEPMASYLTTIAIGPYEEHVDETPTGFAISYWVMDRDRDLLDKLVADGDAALPWLVEKAGPYPFSTLGVVVVGGDSGMETQTMVTMSRAAVLRSDAVLLHEFAHMWYGNSVSPRDWQGMWLNEGWAMYMQQWFERDTGMPNFLGGIDRWGRYDNASRRLAGPPGDYDPEFFGDSNVYLGPAMMLDRIRERVGDTAFERLARDWADEHAGEHVDRETFTRWISAETGEDLEPLIDRWLDSPRTPR
jgi:aminopeptidase N